MKHPELIRARVLRLIQALRIYISCLPETEEEAMKLLLNAEVHVRITDHVLWELGNREVRDGQYERYYGDTRRAIGKLGLRGETRKRRKTYDRTGPYWEEKARVKAQKLADARAEKAARREAHKLAVKQIVTGVTPDPIYKESIPQQALEIIRSKLPEESEEAHV